MQKHGPRAGVTAYIYGGKTVKKKLGPLFNFKLGPLFNFKTPKSWTTF